MKHIVIIGAGLGGLTAGALLAQKGLKVTLLEQHNIVGGCATTFKRGDFTCEVGLHKMDGVYSNNIIKKVFTDLKVYENIEFLKPKEFFRIQLKNSEFVMPNGLENAKYALKQQFPNQHKAIDKYFKIITNISKNYEILQSASWYHYLLFPIFFKDILKYKNKTVTQVLNKLTNNEELKLILNANIQYYNDSPDKLSFLLHAVAQTSYYKGGYYIKGGSWQLSNYLANIITKNQGTIITRANVIKYQKNSVIYMHKKNKKSINCDFIISNISPMQTYKLYNINYPSKKELGISLYTIYLGFKKDLKQVYSKRAYSNFIYDDISSFKEFQESLKQDVANRGFVFVDYSQIDSNLAKNGKSFAVVCSIDYIRTWQTLSKKEYQQKKQKLINSTLKKLENYYPGIKDLVEYAEVGTSKTVKRYIKTPNGTPYGFKPTPKIFFKALKVKSKKIKNLYFVGQWVIAGGFSPAILSGYFTYKKILKDIS